MDNTAERENLEALTQSDGWKVFAAHVDAEWGPGGRAFTNAVTQAANGTDNPMALAHLQQIITAQKLIQGLLKWPDERLKQIQEPELQPLYPRRGRL